MPQSRSYSRQLIRVVDIFFNKEMLPKQPDAFTDKVCRAIKFKNAQLDTNL